MLDARSQDSYCRMFLTLFKQNINTFYLATCTVQCVYTIGALMICLLSSAVTVPLGFFLFRPEFPGITQHTATKIEGMFRAGK